MDIIEIFSIHALPHAQICRQPQITIIQSTFITDTLPRFDVCFEKGEDFPAVYDREKPQQITDASALEVMIDEVIAANPKQVEQYRAGKKTVAGFFVGQVMRTSKGQANPALLNELVTKKLDG